MPSTLSLSPSPTFRLKLGAARTIGALARRTGRGGGTSLPGKVLNKLEPTAISALAGRLSHGNVAISATNGKTTTAAMTAAILTEHGTTLVHNRTGANMAGGIATTLADATRHGGRQLTGDLGLFEVDEFWLPSLAAQLAPHTLLLGNLFRDQLDRYGELDTIAERWCQLVAERAALTTVVTCADDPLVAAVGLRADNAIYYGVDDPNVARGDMDHAADAKHCRACGACYDYTLTYLAHLGHWRCSRCSARRPDPSVRASAVRLHGVRSAHFTLHVGRDRTQVDLPLPGLYNVYNALGAAALCSTLGVDLPTITAGLAAVSPAFGRAETFNLHGQELSVLLIKNPTGANEVLRTLALEPAQLNLLGVLNDGIADGRDVSWIWDIDWEVLASRAQRVTCAGNRAAELAIRLKYAGIPPQRLHVVEDLATGLDAALAAAGDGPVHALPTYTAMLDLQALLSTRGHTKAYWA